jgi:hypothetical protein
MSTCPSNPPSPQGFTIWKGAVPTPLTQWAIDLRDHINASPYGTVWTTDYKGLTVAARKDYHTWTYRKQPDGSVQLVTGICIPGITLYSASVAAEGGGAAGATDPATATPDPTLAVYGAYDVQAPAPPSSTGTIVAGVVVGVLALGAIAIAVRAARLRAEARRMSGPPPKD